MILLIMAASVAISPPRTQVPVKMINDESQARLIFDPMRREMLRLLARNPLTERDLSDVIGISGPSVHHHLRALKRGGLVSIVRSEAEHHGIVRNWYSSNAQAYVVDRDNLRDNIQRYFMPMDIERTRGISATLSLLKGNFTPTTKRIESLTEQVCTALCKTAQEYRGGPEGDPEKVIHRLYLEALKQIEI
jgi:DNA-binding transcriptional ArsR family regulator